MRASFARLALLVVLTPAVAQPPDLTPFPRDAPLPAVGKWLDREYERLAKAERPQTSTGACVTLSIVVRADAIAPDEWVALADRCRAAIQDGPADARIAALNFTGWHLQQAASLDKTLTGRFGPALLASVTEATQSPDRATQIAAIGVAMGAAELSTDPLAVVPVLIRVLRDEDDEVRRRAATALSILARDGTGLGTHAPAAVAALLTTLDDHDKQVRAQSYFALGALGQSARAAVPTLLPRLRSHDRVTRRLSLLTLQRIGPAAAAAVPDLITTLNDPDALICSAAIRALGAIGPQAWPAVPALMSRLDDPCPDIPWIAAKALGDIGPAAAPALPRLRAAVAIDPEAFSGCGRTSIERILGWTK